ncbi:MAG TPA: antitoxin [Acidimicrobiales bacterium]
MDKVKGMLGQNRGKVDSGIDKAGDTIDDRTGGKYAGQVDKGQDAARDALDKLDGGDGSGQA